MAALSYANRASWTSTDSNGLKGRVRERVHDYFRQHPEESFEELLLMAVGKEIDRREGPSVHSPAPARVTEQDCDLHAWLAERIEAMHRERTLWGRAMTFLNKKIF